MPQALLFTTMGRALALLRGSLRIKFIIMIVALEMILMGTVTLVMEHDQRQAILEQARLRALSLGESLAALSEVYLLSYNFVQLEQAAEKITADDEDVRYTVVYLRDGKVAAFSGRGDLQGKMLHDPVSQRALSTDKPLTQEISMPQCGEPGYDVAIPVYAPRSAQKWGTIRLGFSLHRAYVHIHRTRQDLIWLSLAAIIGGTSLAIILALRISKPINHLVAGVHQVAGGAYDRPIQVESRDEIGYLAETFEQMRQSLREHLATLAREKQLLEETNRQLQTTQQHLVQSERLAAVGKLAARVAHEVNNPLAIIKTTLCLMKGQKLEDDTAKRHLEMVEEEIGRIARILRDLLDFSRPNPTAQSTEVNAVIQSLERLLAPNLYAKQITLDVMLDPKVSQAQLSPDHLKQVLFNLVRNAEDAMPEGGRLTMRTARTDDGIEVCIADTGCGIPQEHLPYLFEPFFTTKTQQGGMGLGLSVLYGIVQGVHGQIVVESESGKGSTFRVILPVCGT